MLSSDAAWRKRVKRSVVKSRPYSIGYDAMRDDLMRDEARLLVVRLPHAMPVKSLSGHAKRCKLVGSSTRF